jgi:hypothetical protein
MSENTSLNIHMLSYGRFPDITSCSLVAGTDDSEIYTVAFFKAPLYDLFV